MKCSVSVIVPALNEESTIAEAIQSVGKVSRLANVDYEILVYDDGSTDNTGAISDAFAKKDRRVRVFHNGVNRGLGFIFREAIQKAKKSHFMFYPGDADMASWSLLELIKRGLTADLVIGYPRNEGKRAIWRRIISKGFVVFMNALMGMNLRYFTGPFICRVDLVRNLRFESNGYSSLFEFKVRLVKTGHTYREVPFDHIGRSFGGSKALRLKNILDAIRIAFLLFGTYRLSSQRKG